MPPFFDSDVYCHILKYNRYSDQSFMKCFLQVRVKEEWPDLPCDLFEQVCSKLQAIIDYDIKVLEGTLYKFQEKVKLRNNDDSKYKEIAKWTVDIWKEASIFILGKDWQRYKIKRGRPSDNETILARGVQYLRGSTLAECGFADASKAGTFLCSP